MLFKTKAIILHYVKYGESGLIVHAYTEHFGRQSLMVHGARKHNSKMSPTLFEALSILDIDMYKKENREIKNLKEVKSSFPLIHLHSDIRRSSVAMFIAEILYRTLQEEEANSSLFNYLIHTIQILDISEKGIEYIPLLFLIQFSKFLGIYPGANPEIINYKSPGGNELADLIDYSLSDLNKLSMSYKSRSEWLEILIMHYKNHLEGMGEIKSMSVLREIFH
jgi:DNA repair protein RecO (recombination protein O)